MPGSRRGTRAHAAYPEPGTSPSGEGGHVRPQRDPREGWVGKRIGERRGRHIFDPGVPVQGLRRATSPRVARGPRPLRTAGYRQLLVGYRQFRRFEVAGAPPGHFELPVAQRPRPDPDGLQVRLRYSGPEQAARTRRPSRAPSRPPEHGGPRGISPAGLCSSPGTGSSPGSATGRAVRPHQELQPRAPSSWPITRG